jgi:hypothetical protein
MTPILRPRRVQGDRITVQEVDTETLVYDERTHKAWCLNRSSACVWRLCDGQNTVAEIAAVASAELESAVTEDLVLLTLEELRKKGLVESGAAEILPQGISRRQMMGRIGLAAAALLPVVAALTAPPAMAQSGSVGTGVVGGEEP